LRHMFDCVAIHGFVVRGAPLWLRELVFSDAGLSSALRVAGS
jgi:hypothetical protein